MLPLSCISWEKILLSTLQSGLPHYIMETRLAKATNNFPIAKSDGHSSCFPFWSMWIMGPCWSFPSSIHCLVSWLSGYTLPWVFSSHHTPYGLSICPHSSSSNPSNDDISWASFVSPLEPPIFPHAWAALGDHFLSQGFNPHLWRPNLLKTEGLVPFKSEAGGRVEFGHISTPQHYLFIVLYCGLNENSPHGTNKRFNQCFHQYYYYHISMLSKSSLSPYKGPFLSHLIESSLISL